MPILQLRNHIPISGPARREPVDGTETAMRVSLGFEPAWFHKRCRVDFSERWHTDPHYRHETLVRMKEELNRTFPMITYWESSQDVDTWTISGIFGAYVIPMVFGCRLQYAADRWPMITDRPSYTLEEWAEFRSEELLSRTFVAELFNQMDEIEKVAGKIHGYLNWQSVINNAFHLRGQMIFTDMLDQPEMTHRFLGLICDVMIKLASLVQERQRRSGFIINQFDISNCVMNMISPDMYHTFIFPYDNRIANTFRLFGVHTCNWNVTPYLHELSRLPKVGYLDMGIMSDMRKARAVFPEARRAVMYSPIRLQEASTEEIRADMQKIFIEVSPCDVVMADIQSQTPDKRVIELIEICRKLEQ